MPKELPPHVQAQIASAGKTIADNSTRVENVKPESGTPTSWLSPGHNQVPEPKHVEPIKPEPPEQKP